MTIGLMEHQRLGDNLLFTFTRLKGHIPNVFAEVISDACAEHSQTGIFYFSATSAFRGVGSYVAHEIRHVIRFIIFLRKI